MMNFSSTLIYSPLSWLKHLNHVNMKAVCNLLLASSFAEVVHFVPNSK
jgi:hypothetical protein